MISDVTAALHPPTESVPEPSEPLALQSPLLRQAGFSHAFFTRRGGISRPPWNSLNLAASTGDDPDAVRENLVRAARTLGVPVEKLYFLSQVHGVDACVLTGDEDRERVLRHVGDITLSRVPGVACGARSADCVPVLLADRRSGAVAAVHSGWRGTVLGAAREGVAALRKLVAAELDVVAAIGPHIERCCFQVGADVAEQLAGASSAGGSAIHHDPHGKALVDLRLILRAQLRDAGMAGDCIDDVAGCTVCQPDRYFSYRRDGQRSGRLLSAIVSCAR
jgi:hypothetical protein